LNKFGSQFKKDKKLLHFSPWLPKWTLNASREASF
jgi:hypothetical protein